MAKETFRVSGKKIEIPAVDGEWTFQSRPGGWMIGTRKTDSGIERKRFFIHEAKGKLSFSLDGFLFHGAVETEARAGSSAGGSDLDLNAQFPGKVRKILVAEGAKIEEGTPMMLLEAMKMEFSVKAPYSGTVTRILVKEGQQLQPGDRLLDLER